MADLVLRELPGAYAISRLDPQVPIPEWAQGPGFVSITRTADEISIICLADQVPDDVKSDGPWTCFQLLGPFDLSLSGIAVRVMEPISKASIGILFVTTFDTDYALVKLADRTSAIGALERTGISVRR